LGKEQLSGDAMKKIISNPYLLLVLRLILAFVFIYAGAEKISSPVTFAESVSNYQLLNAFFIVLVSVLLPWLEVFCGVLLLSGVAVRENAFLINVMLSVFILAGIISLMRGLDIDCGCFGDASVKLGFMKIFENVLLLIAGILLMIYSSDLFSVKKI
jgi:putative oxidoreductase